MAEPRRLTQLARSAREIVARAADGPLLVALSGGADSAAAAWAAVDSGRPTRAVHVHHDAPASDMLERAAVAVGEALDIPVDVVDVTVEPGPSYEAQAREARHAALAAQARSGEWVVMGHTRDDQVETVLMRLVRGTGLDGLAGMARDLRPYLRPLLDLSRSDARELATVAGLPWRDDPSNLDRRHLRNRVRMDLIPMIESSFGTGLSTTLHRSADVVRRDLEVLERLVASVPLVAPAAGERRLPLRDLVESGEAIAARAVRNAIRELKPPYPPPARVVDAALEVAARTRFRADIGDLSISVSDGWLVLTAAGDDPVD